MNLFSISWLFVLVLFVSCGQNNSKHIAEPNRRLANFKIYLVYTVDSLELLDSKVNQAINSKEFNSKTDTIKYINDKIYISFLTTATGCANYTGDIKFTQDTIKLLLINKLETVCSEQDCYRLVYEIENKNNKKYIIAKY